MYSNYDFYKANQFLEKTNQPEYILGGVTGLLQYDEIDILDMIEDVKPSDYYMIEKLYCKIIQDMDYNVPFTLEELFYSIQHYPEKNYKQFSQSAYDHVKALYKRLLFLYPF